MTLKKHIVLYKKLSDALMQRLEAQAQVTLIERLDEQGMNQLRAALPRAHGLLGASLKLDAQLLDLAPQLEAIASVSVGVDNYDIDYLTEHKILLSNTPDVLTETTADTGFALILASARRVVESWRLGYATGCGKKTSAPSISAPTCMAKPWALSAWAESAKPWPSVGTLVSACR